MLLSSLFASVLLFQPFIRATDTEALEKRQNGVPATVTTAGPFVYALCAVEPFYNGIEARSLHGASRISDVMTVEACASYCSSFNYFGVEFANECYWLVSPYS